MLLVKQNKPTNCFQACVATLLQLDIDEVSDACDGAKWDWDKFQSWLATLGLQAIEIYMNDSQFYPVSQDVLCILTGPSLRDCKSGQHAVVGKFIGLEGFELFHDPHPSNDFLGGEPTHICFIVPLNLADYVNKSQKEKNIPTQS